MTSSHNVRKFHRRTRVQEVILHGGRFLTGSKGAMEIVLFDDPIKARRAILLPYSHTPCSISYFNKVIFRVSTPPGVVNCAIYTPLASRDPSNRT